MNDAAARQRRDGGAGGAATPPRQPAAPWRCRCGARWGRQPHSATSATAETIAGPSAAVRQPDPRRVHEAGAGRQAAGYRTQVDPVDPRGYGFFDEHSETTTPSGRPGTFAGGNDGFRGLHPIQRRRLEVDNGNSGGILTINGNARHAAGQGEAAWPMARSAGVCLIFPATTGTPAAPSGGYFFCYATPTSAGPIKVRLYDLDFLGVVRRRSRGAGCAGTIAGGGRSCASRWAKVRTIPPKLSPLDRDGRPCAALDIRGQVRTRTRRETIALCHSTSLGPTVPRFYGLYEGRPGIR
ncbi:MAG: hypothetical protein U1E53_04775 [Dongiaceae bacterium]